VGLAIQFNKICLPLLVSIFFLQNLEAQGKKAQESGGQNYEIETLFEGDDVIWGFDFISSHQIIFTERKGKLKVLDLKTRKAEVVDGAPSVASKGQGGLLDIRVLPGKQNEIYFTFSENVEKGMTTSLGKATLAGSKVTDYRKIFSASAVSKNAIHFGSRIEFDGQGHLWITVGDRNERQLAQDKTKHNGKILKLKLDGSAPEIWSYGHRSPQGLFFSSKSNQLWMSEMGPRGGDEINLISNGKNYGWPIVTYGKEYWGPSIGETEMAGFEQPMLYWVPSISPSGMMIYEGASFPKWKGHIFLATLSGQHLRRIEKQGDKLGSQYVMLSDHELRFRNVRTGPDGHIYLSTDQGKLLRLIPKT
jgi:glucose/arabinose dehydrogenase